jgi:hypothetical protein
MAEHPIEVNGQLNLEIGSLGTYHEHLGGKQDQENDFGSAWEAFVWSSGSCCPHILC